MLAPRRHLPKIIGAGIVATGWHIDRLGVSALWEETLGAGITVAVIDSGAADVPGLDKPRIRRFRDGQELQVGKDHNHEYHGTQVTGIVASDDERARGIAPEASCLVYDVYDSSGEPEGWRVTEAIEAAVEASVDLMCCSFSLNALPRELVDALERAHEAKIPVVVSAGNDERVSSPFPEQASGLITVAASGRFNEELRGRRGDWTTITAPGYCIPAWTPDDVSTLTGTSAAAPVAAGVIALLLAHARERGREDWLRENLIELLRETGEGRGNAPLFNPGKLFDEI